jgi:hypothetical protein
LGVATVISSGTFLKVAWLFREAGSNTWLIIPPVALGTAECACVTGTVVGGNPCGNPCRAPSGWSKGRPERVEQDTH